MLAVLLSPALPTAAAAQPPPPAEAVEDVLAELQPPRPLAPGVTHREFTTTDAAGQVLGDVVEVDLTEPAARLDLLTDGAVASRAPVAGMVDGAGAVAGINGDFFDIGRTSAPAGPAVQDGRPLKAAVPQGRRAAPRVPGASMDYVFAVGADRVARVDRLPLQATASTADGPLPVAALNQYAVPVGTIGIFTTDWGEVDRARTLCGSDTDRDAPCAPDRVEVVVRGGAVAEIRPPRGGTVPPDELVLAGRDEGAAALRALEVGEPVRVEFALVPRSGVAPVAAVGGQPILADGGPTEDLDDAVRAPRSAAAVSADGRRVYLVTVDGRQDDSIGATLAELSALLAEMGADDGLNLDGGGSSTLAVREPDGSIRVVNDPSDSSARLVPNGLGAFSG